MTEGPGKEHETNKPPPTRRVQEKFKRRCHMSHHLPEPLLESILAEQRVHHQEGLWDRITGQRQSRNESYHHKTWDYKPSGRTVLLGSPALLFSAQVPLPDKVSCFVSMCVSSDNLFPRVRQEPTLRPWKGSPFLQQFVHLNHMVCNLFRLA